ncbi:c-type heme family protein [Lysobacter olei]
MKRGFGIGLMAGVALLAGCGQQASEAGVEPPAATPSAAGTATAAATTTPGLDEAPADAASAQEMPSPEPDAIPDAAPANAEARAKAAAADFSGQLKSALMAQLQAGGPVQAVEFCHAQAPRIAKQVAQVHGVRLGRVAVPGRNRNPAHEATGWQLDAAQAFQQAVDAGGNASEQVRLLTADLPQGVAARFAKGIAVEPACLACHGQQVSPPVLEVLARHYPGDRATGFDVGDLRGLLWVEVPAGAGASREANTQKENRP